MISSDLVGERLQGLLDRADIARLVYDYNHSLDEREADLFASLWAPDAVWNFVAGFGMFTGRDTIITAFHTFWSFHESMHHCATNVVVTVSGEHATGRSKSVGRAVAASGRAHESFISYDDAYVRLDGRWLFARRDIRVHKPNVLEAESAALLAELS